MKDHFLRYSMYLIAVLFTLLFVLIVVPAFLDNPDLVYAFGSGFVNPFSTGYSLDVVFCWSALACWVFYERKVYSVKHGWLCLVLGVVPGVAVSLPLYLVLRQSQLKQSAKSA